ncbi:ThiF family adenylyltransferase [Clostridium tagluense]|uniref:ThiF family adenylyltransferase n=1 Tax=Clostridium tagluense TaxID=360422 RepID=UPI001CF3A706|nr:ThiF family adenylyltransferase [Clostridium tagluense]MCB2313235.1 ThiF family adenylyltransferase [Clostridium tagluense]MCB2318014.1 ThiF family adenylyltransferase [Clostridium tagluense]MCB2322790.1 ThiF family adenylyltransferase [Clostridium tagluense]MCB2327798.1 ThiF family adenylyltransferase [Clostridium tagluense]MCB2332445.1 ThiF family adenylyltransferase [Clostridium tagluense]
MYLLRKNEMCEIVLTNTHYIITDNTNSRYIKIKKNTYIEFILDLIDKAVLKYEDIIALAIEKKIDTKKIETILNQFINMKFIERVYFPEIENYEILNKYEIQEMFFNDRFGQEIAWLANFENEKYDRFELFKKISQLSILIVGAGGLGSHLAVMCAAMGVGKICIVDGDKVDKSNLTRQIFYKESQAGACYKVDALKAFINDFNPNTNIVTEKVFINNLSIADKVIDKSIDIVIQTADYPKGILDRIVNQICVEKKIACLFTHHKSIGPFYIPAMSSCYSCFETFLNEDSNGIYDEYISFSNLKSSRKSPSFVTGPIILANHIINEILRYISEATLPYTFNKLMRLHGELGEVSFLDIAKQDNCACLKGERL